jgi:hypothetical protein
MHLIQDFQTQAAAAQRLIISTQYLKISQTASLAFHQTVSPVTTLILVFHASERKASIIQGCYQTAVVPTATITIYLFHRTVKVFFLVF